MDVDAVIYVVIGADRDGNRSIGRFRDRGVRVGTQKKGILVDETLDGEPHMEDSGDK